MDARARPQAEALQRTRRGDQQRRGRVANLTRHCRRDTPAWCERRERGHLLERGACTRRLVAVQSVERCELADKVSARTGFEGAAVALQSEFLHLAAADVPLRGDHLRGTELRNLLRAVALAPAARAAEGIGYAIGPAGGHGRVERNLVHALHSAGDHHVLRAAHHGLGGKVQRLLRGAALAVDRRAGHVLGEACRQPAGACDVARLRTELIQAAEDHVFDLRRVHRGALDEGTQYVGAEVRRVHARESSLLAAGRGAYRADEVGFVGCAHGHGLGVVLRFTKAPR
jgi:hypothetical protein